MNLAVIRIDAKKDARCAQTVVLIQGDRRTQILRFDVNRFDGGVDLSGLVWAIKTVNANGIEDVFQPVAVNISENRIVIDWLVDGTVTAASGTAKYELNGLSATAEGEAVVWKGGTGTMSLRANIGENFGEIDMTNIDRLVLYVEDRLQDIIDLTEELRDSGTVANAAAEAANAAAEAANAGASRANTAANAANIGATSATEAASNARTAAEAANAAALSHAQLYGTRVCGETAKVSGNLVSFQADAGSLLRPVTVLEPRQQGSGDPSPDNIRPFIGWDKLGLTVAKRNLLPDFQEATANGITLKKLDDGGFTLSGTASAMTYFTAEFTPVLPAGKYSISVNNPETNGRGDFWFGMFDGNDERIYVETFGGVNRKASVTVAKDIEYFKIQIPGGLTLNNFVIKPQVEKGDAATEYSDPSRVFTVQIGQTVYGGRFYWLTGKLVAEWMMKDLSTASWVQVTDVEWATAANAIPCEISQVGELVSDRFKAVSFYDMRQRAGGKYLAAVSDNGSLHVYNGGESSPPSEGQIAYKLAEPVEIQLTPTIISAAVPEQTNTLYGDGVIEVEYVKPLHVSIEERGSGGSGGSGSANMYKLIETITIDTDDIDMVSRRKEPDGTPYSYSAVCVMLEQSPNQVTGTRTIKVFVTGDVSFDMPLTNNATYKTYGSIVVENRRGKYFADVGVSLANPTNMNVQFHRPAALIGYYAGRTIENVYMHPYGTTFANGTKIEIWAVRA